MKVLWYFIEKNEKLVITKNVSKKHLRMSDIGKAVSLIEMFDNNVTVLVNLLNDRVLQLADSKSKKVK